MSFLITRRYLLRMLAVSGIACNTFLAKAEEALPASSDVKNNQENLSLSLLAAGTENSLIGQWATHLAPSLASNFQINENLPIHYTTGHDGVTGANLFDTRIPPDGNTALLTPGTVIIAAMAGDERVHFDYERWIPIFTVMSSAVTIAREAYHHSLHDIFRNRKMRIAVSTPVGKELPTLLGIELLNITPVPVTGLADHSAAIQALQSGHVDAIQLSTAEALAELPSLLQSGFHILFSLDKQQTYGPYFKELIPPALQHHRNDLFDVWDCLSIAARLEVSLILPMLTPASLVAKWRRVGTKTLQDPAIMQFAQQQKLVLQNDLECIETFTKMTPSFTAALALRRWLAVKLPDWQTS